MNGKKRDIAGEFFAAARSASEDAMARAIPVLQGRVMPKGPPDDPRLVRVTQAARLLGISRISIWRMMRSGLIASVELLPGLRRIPKSEIDRLAEIRP
jgi:excisionase family DNA binding protein